ncbi:MAG: hypothetical protein B7Z66_11585 [Chromatiales bacterium 21-64-14]|nr:MAG: hypothetical protein B7Z66_11585 [Chromatiales bacterium 21-64-14]
MHGAERVATPQAFLGTSLGATRDNTELGTYQRWGEDRGEGLSAAVDRAGTPGLRLFDRSGAGLGEARMPCGNRTLLQRGYAADIVARAFDRPRCCSSIASATSPYSTSMSTFSAASSLRRISFLEAAPAS